MKNITFLIVTLIMTIASMNNMQAQITVEKNKLTEFANAKIYPLMDAEKHYLKETEQKRS